MTDKPTFVPVDKPTFVPVGDGKPVFVPKEKPTDTRSPFWKTVMQGVQEAQASQPPKLVEKEKTGVQEVFDELKAIKLPSLGAKVIMGVAGMGDNQYVNEELDKVEQKKQDVILKFQLSIMTTPKEERQQIIDNSDVDNDWKDVLSFTAKQTDYVSPEELQAAMDDPASAQRDFAENAAAAKLEIENKGTYPILGHFFKMGYDPIKALDEVPDIYEKLYNNFIGANVPYRDKKELIQHAIGAEENFSGKVTRTAMRLSTFIPEMVITKKLLPDMGIAELRNIGKANKLWSTLVGSVVEGGQVAASQAVFSGQTSPKDVKANLRMGVSFHVANSAATNVGNLVFGNILTKNNLPTRLANAVIRTMLSSTAGTATSVGLSGDYSEENWLKEGVIMTGLALLANGRISRAAFAEQLVQRGIEKGEWTREESEQVREALIKSTSPEQLAEWIKTIKDEMKKVDVNKASLADPQNIATPIKKIADVVESVKIGEEAQKKSEEIVKGEQKDEMVRDPIKVNRFGFAAEVAPKEFALTIANRAVNQMSVDEIREKSYTKMAMSSDRFNALAESIKQEGIKVPLLIDESNRVIEGSHRLYVGKKLGIKSFPVIRINHWEEGIHSEVSKELDLKYNPSQTQKEKTGGENVTGETEPYKSSLERVNEAEIARRAAEQQNSSADFARNSAKELGQDAEVVAELRRIAADENNIQASASAKQILSIIDAKEGGRIATDLNSSNRKQRLRAFIQTVEGSPKTSKDLENRVDELEKYYDIIGNQESIKAADEAIKNDFLAAQKSVMETDVPGVDKIVTAIRLMKLYEKNGNVEEASKLIDFMTSKLTESGRFIQAASLWNQLGSASFLKKANDASKKYNGKPLDAETKQDLLKKFNEVTKMPEGDEKTKATMDLLDYAASLTPLKYSEMFTAFRYNNMLSNPLSHWRNIYGNLFNTFITEPSVIGLKAFKDSFTSGENKPAVAVKFSDIPKYYKDVVSSVSTAMTLAKEAYLSNRVDQRHLDVSGRESMSSIEEARQRQMPKFLSVATRTLEAEDSFFRTLLATGEKARLLRKGVSEEQADIEAKKLADRYLYRDKLDWRDEDRLVVTRAFDAIGQGLESFRKAPAIGKPFSWFVPFLKTPVNIAKRNMEFSPIAGAEMIAGKLKGKKYTDTQVSQALLGSMVTMTGALLAANGNTEWATPKDEKERRLFYDSGRKPFSVKLGNTWVPMQYFGPFALAMAIPAAAKYYTQDHKEALSSSQAEKLSKVVLNLGDFILANTPYQGLEDFNNLLQDENAVGKLAGRTATQLIPLSGLVRYTNQWLDPVYRKTKTFQDAVKSGLPGYSRSLEPHTNLKGIPVNRDAMSKLFPYAVGIDDPKYSDMLQKYRESKQKQQKKKTK